MKDAVRYNLIVAVSSILNYSNNAIIQFFLPVFTERALKRGISEFQIGLILSVYAFSIVLQSFLVDRLRSRLGSRRTYLLGVSLGAIVSILSVALNYMPRLPFILIASLLKFFDGIREPQFEVVAFIYFAEGVLPGTTKAMQGRSISIYKTFGAMGYLLGSLQAPALLEALGYDGGFFAFLFVYSIALGLCAYLLPAQVSAQPAEGARPSLDGPGAPSNAIESITMWQVLTRSDLQSCFLAIFTSMFVQMGITGTLTMHLIQTYSCQPSTAYYLMAVWGTGLTLGNCLSSCLVSRVRNAVFGAFIGLMGSLVLIGPSKLVQFTEAEGKDCDSVGLRLGAMGLGLFIMGLCSAFLQTLCNISSVERAQAWARAETYSLGAEIDVQPLLSKVQSWVIVMIGGGEAAGQVVASYTYSRYDFSTECDVFNVMVLLCFFVVLYLERRITIKEESRGQQQQQPQFTELQEQTSMSMEVASEL